CGRTCGTRHLDHPLGYLPAIGAATSGSQHTRLPYPKNARHSQFFLGSFQEFGTSKSAKTVRVGTDKTDETVPSFCETQDIDLTKPTAPARESRNTADYGTSSHTQLPIFSNCDSGFDTPA